MQRIYNIILSTLFVIGCLAGFYPESSVEAASNKTPMATATPVLDNRAISRIYEGQSFELLVNLFNATPVPPVVAPSDDFQVELLGDRSENKQSLIIINNRRIDNSQKKHLYVYRLTPKKLGALKTPEFRFQTDGQTITADPVEIEVLKAAAQDLIRLKILATSHGEDISNQPIYPMQPFDVTVRVQLKALPGQLSDRPPTSVLDTPPQLNIPWANDTLPQGLKPVSELATWLGAYQQSHGFSINGYQKQMSPMDLMSDPFFSGVMGPRLLAFLPTPKTVELPDAEGFNCTYFQYDFTRRFIASQTGVYSFGPVSFKGVLATEIKNGSLNGDNIYATAPPVSVRVAVPPTKGRPNNYINAVGIFDINAQLTPTSARVGDPLTLTLTIRGEGTLEEITAPDLSKNKKIAENFKIYDATESSEEGKVEFTYSLRPLKATVREFPPVSVSYFDIATREYVQMSTKSVPLKIQKADSLSLNDIQSSEAPLSGTELKNQQGGIHAYITDIDRIYNQRVRLERFLITLGSMLLVYCAAVGGIVAVRVHNSNPVKLRRRRAESTALELLAQADSAVPGDKTEEKIDGAIRALNGFIADKLNVLSAGLTPPEALQALELTRRVDEPLLNRIRQFYQEADWSRYAGGLSAGSAAASQNDPVEQAREIIAQLNRALK